MTLSKQRQKMIRRKKISLIFLTTALVLTSAYLMKYLTTGETGLTSLLTDATHKYIQVKSDKTSAPVPTQKEVKASALEKVKKTLPIEDCVEDTVFVSNPAINKVLNVYADALGTQILTLSDVPAQYTEKFTKNPINSVNY